MTLAIVQTGNTTPTRGFFEPGDPVNLEDFPKAIAKHIESGTLIDGFRAGQAFDCFYVQFAPNAHLILSQGGGYDSFLEGNDADQIPDPANAAHFKDFVHGLGRELGINAYV